MTAWSPYGNPTKTPEMNTRIESPTVQTGRYTRFPTVVCLIPYRPCRSGVLL